MNTPNQETILRMVSEGKITADEGMELLEALSSLEKRQPPTSSARTAQASSGTGGKFLRIIVKIEDDEDNMDVDLNLPLSFAERLAPALGSIVPSKQLEKLKEKGVDIEMISSVLQTVGSLGDHMEGRDLVNVNVEDPDSVIKVRIYVE